MDEPTAALTKRESEELYRITEQLRDEGKGIIFISHRFEDVFRLASHVTVFRDSRYIGDWDVSEITGDKLIYAMVGRTLTQMYPETTASVGAERFRVEGLGKLGYFKDVSFDVRAGEIVAVSGWWARGAARCAGDLRLLARGRGQMFLDGKEVHPPARASDEPGIGYLPEDRQKQGLILDWTIGSNITLATLNNMSKRRPERESRRRRPRTSSPKWCPSRRRAFRTWQVPSPAATSRRSSWRSCWRQSSSSSFWTSPPRAWTSARSTRSTRSCAASARRASPS